MNKVSIGCVALAWVLAASPPLAAQTPGERTVETRLTLGLLVPAAEVQRWLPDPWVVRPPADAPPGMTALNMIFLERMLVLAPDGSIMDGGVDRGLVLSAAASNPRTGDQGSYVIRGYTANPDVPPGAYGNYQYVELDREAELSASGVDAGRGEEEWRLEHPDGGHIELEIEFQRSVPVRSTPDARVRGGPDPDFYRIYRLDQGTDVVLSEAEGIDRVEEIELEVTFPELRALFDGTHRIVSVTVTPWYVRDVFLP